MSDAPAPPKTLLGRARRSLVGAARWVSATAKGMALGGFGLASVLFLLFPAPGVLPAPLALVALGAIAAMLASPFVGVVGMLLRLGGLRREGEVHHDARGLFITRPDGRQWVLGANVASGVVVPSKGQFDVQLRFVDGNEASILVRDEATADALLDLIGVGPEQRRTRVSWASLPKRVAAGVAGAVTGLTLATALLMIAPEPFNVPAVFFWFMAPFLAPPLFAKWLAWRDLEVGTDGIAWRYGRKRDFVPLGRVSGVDVQGDDLVVRLVDGTDRRFTISKDGLAEGLRRRVEALLASVGDGLDRQALFARGEQTFAQWVERMRGLLKQEGTHRSRPVQAHDAMAVLEDPQADPDARVGAALALGHAEGPAAAARVRVVAETCVHPKLRVALELAAQGEVEEEVVEDVRRELRLARRDD